MELPSKVEDYPTWMKGRIQAFNNIAFQTLQRPEPKMFGTREENGVSTPHVISMRSYARTQEKHAKKDFYQSMLFYPFLGLIQSQVSHIDQPNILTISTSNIYPNTLGIIYYNPNIKEYYHKNE